MQKSSGISNGTLSLHINLVVFSGHFASRNNGNDVTALLGDDDCSNDDDEFSL